MRCADGESRLGHATRAPCRNRERDTEICDHRFAVEQQDVRGFDVPVDHPVPVRVVERFGDVRRDAHRFVHGQLVLAVETRAEALVFRVRHHVEQESVRVARVEEREDVRMLKVGGGLDLREEPARADDCGELGLEHLERDPATVLQVLGEVNRGHATLAELALDAVAAGEGCVQPGHSILVWHARKMPPCSRIRERALAMWIRRNPLRPQRRGRD